MSNYEEEYLKGLQYILDNGVWELNKRTGVRCLTVPSYMFEYDLTSKGIPLLTQRPSYPVSAIAEILGYLRCYTNAQDFADIGSPTWFANSDTEIWRANPNYKGLYDLGTVYGASVGKEYIRSVLGKICNGEDDRGLKLDWWQVNSFDKSCLRPCLSDHQFILSGGKVNLTSVQRSCDYMCGKNFNAIQVYFLGMLACQLSGLEGGKATHIINHMHIYEPHLEGVEELLSRKPIKLDVEFNLEKGIMYPEDLIDSNNHARDYFKLTGYKGIAQPKIDFDLIA